MAKEPVQVRSFSNKRDLQIIENTGKGQFDFKVRVSPWKSGLKAASLITKSAQPRGNALFCCNVKPNKVIILSKVKDDQGPHPTAVGWISIRIAYSAD